MTRQHPQHPQHPQRLLTCADVRVLARVLVIAHHSQHPHRPRVLRVLARVLETAQHPQPALSMTSTKAALRVLWVLRVLRHGLSLNLHPTNG